MNRLAEILGRKREEVRAAKARLPEQLLKDQLAFAPPPLAFGAAISGRGSARVIAEIKRASPSVGAIAPAADAVAQARAYAAGGASAISVLTDGPGFGGAMEDLRSARAEVQIPLLRKDFIVDAYQLYEARAAGADAVLLIAAALDDPTLRSLLRAASALQLDALVEVHDAAEADRALAAGAHLVGINNRDLATFQVDLATSEKLLDRVSDAAVAVVESGIRTALDARRLGRAGASTFLVGEALMRARTPAAFIAELRAAVATSFRVKVCGVTSAEDAAEAVAAGADAIGFNFWTGSKRYVGMSSAALIAASLPRGVRAIGVFVNASEAAIAHAVETVPLSAVQLHGDEPPQFAERLQAPVIRAVRMESNVALEKAAGYPAAAFLLDAPAQGYGGAGQPFDWSLAVGAQGVLNGPVILAGGLTSLNVKEAIMAAQPDAVDVASGVESAPGKKDRALLRAFVAEAKEGLAR